MAAMGGRASVATLKFVTNFFKGHQMTLSTRILSVLAVAVISATSGISLAHADKKSGGYTYDYGSGNSYTSSGSGYRGYNAKTGAQWGSTTRGSSTSGTDSSGNNWSYNRNSGVYQNYGTGEIRFRGSR